MTRANEAGTTIYNIGSRPQNLIWYPVTTIISMLGYTIHHSYFWAVVDFIFAPVAICKWLLFHEVTWEVIKHTFSWFFALVMLFCIVMPGCASQAGTWALATNGDGTAFETNTVTGETHIVMPQGVIHLGSPTAPRLETSQRVRPERTLEDLSREAQGQAASR